MENRRSNIELSSTWNVLGPFQIGTREAVWGADPMEYYGGFRNLTFETVDRLKSSLGQGGTIQWSKFQASHRRDSSPLDEIHLNISFSDVNWESFQSTYGWAALQYQAWARGIIHVDGTQTHHVALYTDKVLEFWIDGQSYFGGDFYGFRRAPLILHLDPGDHIIDVRLIGDIRSMGSNELPTTRISLAVFDAPLPAMLNMDYMILPDIVDGKLASSLASVPVTNTGFEDLILINITSISSTVNAELATKEVHLYGGQTRPVIFHLSLQATNAIHTEVELKLTFQQLDGSLTQIYSTANQLKNRTFLEPHKFTYLHPSGILSYAMLRPPLKSARLLEAGPSTEYPVFIFLHGAGVEVSSDDAAHCLDAVSDLPAWMIFPSGVTLWSGDDWHQWGWADVEKSVTEIPRWIHDMGWQGPSVDIEQWMVAGHSNGGQGVWYALTHKPDKVFAAIAVSGYLSIQKYVPYTLWREVEPFAMAVIHSSLKSFRHELLVSNSAGIPIMQQHGDADDNVPPFHSRRMSQLLSEAHWGSKYNEIQEAGHWFDGVMTTQSLQEFYHQHLMSRLRPPEIQSIKAFSLISGNPGEIGSKFGFRIDQLVDPAKLGRLDISFESDQVCVHTSNVRRLTVPLFRLSQSSVLIDGQSIPFDLSIREYLFLSRGIDSTWQVKELGTWKSADERQGRQLGNIQSILNTQGSLSIVAEHGPLERIALQISRNLFQYYGADARIVEPTADLHSLLGNVIRVSTNQSLFLTDLENFPITIHQSALTVRDCLGDIRKYEAREDGLACIFLRPLGSDMLELVVWGSSQSSLAVASRLIPTLTGVGQPDFVVLTRKCSREGVGGVLAMGYFDYSWNISPSSFFS